MMRVDQCERLLRVLDMVSRTMVPVPDPVGSGAPASIELMRV